MPRRQKSDPGFITLLIDLLEVATLKYVWIGPVAGIFFLILAIAAYFGLRGNVALVGQFVALLSAIMVLICLGVTLKAINVRADRRTRLGGVYSVQNLHELTWQQFEQLVADAYRNLGFNVREVGGDGTPDGGVDLEMTDTGGTEYLVQCKQWRTWSVGEPKVREFFGAMTHRGGSCRGIYVTCGNYTEPARQFAFGKPMELVDGDGLVKLIGNTPLSQPITMTGAVASPNTTSSQLTDPPVCRSCGIAMVRRTARQGTNAGQDFWGCRNFPRCRQIEAIHNS